MATTNNTIFSDMTPYSPVEHQRFDGTYSLRLQDRRIREADNQREGSSIQSILLVACSAYFSSLMIEAVSSTETSVT
jgi:hypothetical protein